MTAASLTADPQDSFLLIIDLQERLLAAMPEGERDDLIKQVGILLQASEALKIPTTISEQYPQGLGPTEASLLSLSPSLSAIEKTCFSCTDSDEFITTLVKSQRRSVIITGVETHICVLQTALDLKQQGYQVFVVEDGVSSRTTQNKDNALQRLRQAGVIISNTESVLFEWLANAQHPEFRTLAKLIV